MNTTVVRVDAPSRLHFGLLAWGDEAPRQFGSVGLMVEDPGLSIVARVAGRERIEGPLAVRAAAVLGHLRQSLRDLPNFHMKILHAASEHVGLGTGTALSLAVARLVLVIAGEPDPTAERLAALTGRGARSGIGLHGSSRGGLLVDGGRAVGSLYPPLLSRLDFAREWSILVVIPGLGRGLAGRAEREAFANLPGLPGRTIDRLCRLVMLELLPAVVEHDLDAFGDALSALQHEVGRGFYNAQGGLYAHPELDSLAANLRRLGLKGVGQSSWGPTLYGFIAADAERETAILRSVTNTVGGSGFVAWTRSSGSGVEIQVESSEERSMVK